MTRSPSLPLCSLFARPSPPSTQLISSSSSAASSKTYPLVNTFNKLVLPQAPSPLQPHQPLPSASLILITTKIEYSIGRRQGRRAHSRTNFRCTVLFPPQRGIFPTEGVCDVVERGGGGSLASEEVCEGQLTVVVRVLRRPPTRVKAGRSLACLFGLGELQSPGGEIRRMRYDRSSAGRVSFA